MPGLGNPHSDAGGAILRTHAFKRPVVALHDLQDFDAVAMKTARYWNGFTRPECFLLQADVIAELDSRGWLSVAGGRAAG